MTVDELIEALRAYPSGTEVVMGLVAPADPEDLDDEDDEDLVVDLITIDAIRLHADDDGSDPLVWLIGGEDDDVAVLLEELDAEED